MLEWYEAYADYQRHDGALRERWSSAVALEALGTTKVTLPRVTTSTSRRRGSA